MEMQNIFVHHVYFWLKNPNSEEDYNKLWEGLKKLTSINTIRSFHIGRPAATDRGVIDNTYNLSWVIIFDNGEDQGAYQIDPIHLQFVAEYSHLWKKVIVYDSIDA